MTDYDDLSRLTLLPTQKQIDFTNPVKLSCKHPVCNSLIKKDIMVAEKFKTVVGLKPKMDLVDIYDKDHANEYEDKRKPYILE